LLSKKIVLRKNSAKAERNLQIFANFAPRSTATVDGMLRPPDQQPDTSKFEPSAAAIWPPLRPFIAGEHRLGRFMARRRWTSALYEFLRFGLKQGWACLFGGIAVFLMIATWWFYPATAWLPRYDFLFLCMITVQIALLAGRLETADEAKVILIYHVVGTMMEIFKTQAGSWIYPEPNFFRHHFMPDLRWLLFALAGWLFLRTRVYFRVWHISRSMPLLLGLGLVSLFIWFSENIGTFTKTWLYPSQRHGWSMVSFDKFGSWFLLLIISYTLVSLVNAPRDRRMGARTIGVREKFNRMPDFWLPRR
jgi:uncharacterized membrane protein YoaT (DUF817 family)